MLSVHTVATWSAAKGVYARRLVGRTARPARLRRISPTGEDTAVAYNATSDEYVVLWVAGGPTAIFGQHLIRRLQEIGLDDFRVSEPIFYPSPGPTGLARHETSPAVAADANSPAYLAAWNTDYDPTLGFYRLLARRLTSVR